MKLLLIAVIMSLPAFATSAGAAPDQTFFGITLGARIDATTCRTSYTEITCLGHPGSEKVVHAKSGETLMEQSLHFPQKLKPDWLNLVTGSVWMINNSGNADAIEFDEDTPSSSVTEEQLAKIHQKLVAKLGKPTTHQPVKFGRKNFHYIETWSESWGQVMFNTAGVGELNIQPVISVISTQWAEMQSSSRKLNADDAAKSDANKLKF